MTVDSSFRTSVDFVPTIMTANLRVFDDARQLRAC